MPINPRRGPFDDRNRRTSWYGIVLRIVPGDSSLLVEVEMAPDSAGAPDTGSARSLGTVGPYARQGGIFVHRQPNDGATRWYRVRHVGASVNPGAFTGWLSGVPAYLDTETIETMATEQATTHPIKREIPLDDGDYNVSSSASNGRKVRETVLDSRDLAINTMFGKTFDDLDDANDGVIYGRPRQTGLTGGDIDFLKGGVINKYAGAMARSSGDPTAVHTIINRLDNAGHAESSMQDSRSLAINIMFAKTADDQDDVVDGTTYKKVTGVNGSNQVTPTSTVGRNRCRLEKTGTQALTTLTVANVTFDAEDYDEGGLHDNVTNNHRVTIPAGSPERGYLLSLQVLVAFTSIPAGASFRLDLNDTAGNVLSSDYFRAQSGDPMAILRAFAIVHPSAGDFYYGTVTPTFGSGTATITVGQTHFEVIHFW